MKEMVLRVYLAFMLWTRLVNYVGKLLAKYCMEDLNKMDTAYVGIMHASDYMSLKIMYLMLWRSSGSLSTTYMSTNMKYYKYVYGVSIQDLI